MLAYTELGVTTSLLDIFSPVRLYPHLCTTAQVAVKIVGLAQSKTNFFLINQDHFGTIYDGFQVACILVSSAITQYIYKPLMHKESENEKPFQSYVIERIILL